HDRRSQSVHAALEDKHAVVPHRRKECTDTRIQMRGIFRGGSLRKAAQGSSHKGGSMSGTSASPTRSASAIARSLKIGRSHQLMIQRLVLIAAFMMPLPAFSQVKLGTSAVNVAQAAAKPWAPSKTADGQPDLQGYWTNNTMAPLQRPKGVTKDF